MTGIRIKQLWRYPVKSLQRERLDSAELTRAGVRGDRVVHVTAPRPLTGHTRHGLLTLRATTGPGRHASRGGTPLGQRRSGAPHCRALTRRRAARPRRVDPAVRHPHPAHRDLWSRRPARPRHPTATANIVLSDVAAAVELEPLGRALQVSGAVIGVHSVRQRCIVTTMAPIPGRSTSSSFAASGTVRR